MNALVIGLFGIVLSVDYLVHERQLLSPYMILLPELLSAVAMTFVLARIVAGARVSLDYRYVTFLVALLVVILVGFVVQGVPTGPMVAGIRAHLKFIPFFLLPTVFPFTAKQLRTQLAVLLGVFVLEMPVALYQRFVEYAHLMQTGDPVRGTATTSSALSLLMMCGIAAVISLYVRRKISLLVTILIAGALFLPTTLNETKATLLLLPVAILGPVLCMPKGSGAAKRVVPIVLLASVAMIAFIAVYDYLIRYSFTGQPIAQFVGQESYLRYLYSGAAEQGANYIGRFDSLEFALQGITRDPFTTAFGLGAGNVSPSFLPQFDGAYAAYYDRFGIGMTEVTSLLWEVGFVGLVTYLFFYYFVLRDARMLSRGDGWTALLGQIWWVVTLIMIFALIYKSVFPMNEIGYPFWFYSGVVAAKAIEQRKYSRQRRLNERRLAGEVALATDMAANVGA